MFCNKYRLDNSFTTFQMTISLRKKHYIDEGFLHEPLASFVCIRRAPLLWSLRYVFRCCSKYKKPSGPLPTRSSSAAHPHRAFGPNQRANSEHAMSKTVKDLKIKTKSLHRCAEPLLASARATSRAREPHVRTPCRAGS